MEETRESDIIFFELPASIARVGSVEAKLPQPRLCLAFQLFIQLRITATDLGSVIVSERSTLAPNFGKVDLKP